jgi:hypothetical protein
MSKYLFLYCIAGLLVSKVGIAQNCSPDAIQKHLAVFWDHFDPYKPLDSFPPSFITNSNKLYKTKEKQFFFMGSIHSTDAGYPLYRKIDSVMADFNPDIILIENYQTRINADINAIVADGSDVGYVSYIGRKNKVRIKSWDNISEVYNRLIPGYGYDNALVMLLNSVGGAGVQAQSGEEGYAKFRVAFQLFGGILTPSQQSYAYYQQIFQQYYKRPLLQPGDTRYAELQLAIQQDQLRKQFNSRFTQLRDRRLLQVLQRELPAHNKIYLQAGAAHFQSLKDIISCYLTPVKSTVKPILSKKDQGKQGILITANSLHNKYQKIMIGFTNYKDSSKEEKTRIEKQIKQFAPDIILTYSPALIFSTKAETFAKSGITGYTRFLGIDKKIFLDQWAPSWGDIYYHFIEKYSNEDLYTTCFAMNILQDGEAHTIDDFRDKFYNAGNIMELSGYPFQDNEFDFNFFIGKIIRNEPNKNSYSLEEMQSFIQHKKNKLLEEGIKKYQVAWFFTTPLCGLQNLNQKKIFIQMDEAYRSFLK